MQIPIEHIGMAMACGHHKAPISLTMIEHGQRRSGGEWEITRIEYEAKCSECGEITRFWFSRV